MSEGAAEAAYDDLCYRKRLDNFECELQDCLTGFVKEYEAALEQLKEQQHNATTNTTNMLLPSTSSTQHPRRTRK